MSRESNTESYTLSEIVHKVLDGSVAEKESPVGVYPKLNRRECRFALKRLFGEPSRKLGYAMSALRHEFAGSGPHQ